MRCSGRAGGEPASAGGTEVNEHRIPTGEWPLTVHSAARATHEAEFDGAAEKPSGRYSVVSVARTMQLVLLY